MSNYARRFINYVKQDPARAINDAWYCLVGALLLTAVATGFMILAAVMKALWKFLME